jgi:hypothetical protein
MCIETRNIRRVSDRQYLAREVHEAQSGPQDRARVSGSHGAPAPNLQDLRHCEGIALGPRPGLDVDAHTRQKREEFVNDFLGKFERNLCHKRSLFGCVGGS